MQIKLTGRETALLRMVHQEIGGTRFARPADLVRWMGCIQAQDYGMAKWAVGCRVAGATAMSVEEAFNRGEILRTHVLRPTWHFVHPDDIRWMLKITAPKVKVQTALYHRRLGIDHTVLKKSKKLLERALGKYGRLTREALTEVLSAEKIDVRDGRIGALLMEAELDAIICSAGREGKKFAYQLLDDVTPTVVLPDVREAVGELARRYFLSRGPAGLADFAWWGGLTLGEARGGLEMNRGLLQPVDVNGKEYWFAGGKPPERADMVLCPAFDELAVAYKDREEVVESKWVERCNFGLSPVVVHEGRVVGVWRRRVGKDEDKGKGKGLKVKRDLERAGKGGEVDVELFKPVRAARALAAAKKRFLDFQGAD